MQLDSAIRSAAGKPVMLKRGMSATVEELLMAAEYVAKEGNERIILCERGIRTFEHGSRNTLDLTAVPALRARIAGPPVSSLMVTRSPFL